MEKSFLKKYLKYKTKYIDLKNNLYAGAAAEPDNNYMSNSENILFERAIDECNDFNKLNKLLENNSTKISQNLKNKIIRKLTSLVDTNELEGNCKSINDNGKLQSINNNTKLQFILYTTGLSNWLNATIDDNTNQNIANYYKLYRENIYKQINQIFPNYSIIIKHYDPLSSLYGNNDNTLLERANIQYIYNITKTDVSDYSKYNIVKSTFINQYFDPLKEDLTIPHIILDFAHIFTYTDNPSIQKIIDSSQKIKDTEYKNLNILRFGFLGDYISQAIFNSQNLITLDDSSNIITLTKLVQIKVAPHFTDYSDPVYTFFNGIITGSNVLRKITRTPIKSIKIRLEDIIKEKYNVELTQAENMIVPSYTENLELVTNISNQLIYEIILVDMIDDANIDAIAQEIAQNAYKFLFENP